MSCRFSCHFVLKLFYADIHTNFSTFKFCFKSFFCIFFAGGEKNTVSSGIFSHENMHEKLVNMHYHKGKDHL